MAKEQTENKAKGGPKGGEVVQLAENAKWNGQRGNTDAAKSQQAITNWVTRNR